MLNPTNQHMVRLEYETMVSIIMAGVTLTLLVFTLYIKSVIACLRQVGPFFSRPAITMPEGPKD